MDFATRVHELFARIAPSYDRTNRLLSLGVDPYWRYRLVRAVTRQQPKDILDIATGSGDVALALARALTQANITGLDFCEPMLEQARRKHPPDTVRFILGDAHALPYEAHTVDAITMAFGFRNLSDRTLCLQECLRILRPGGKLWILEFSQPYRWLSWPYALYLRHVLPRLAGLTSSHTAAYQYLADSIEAFPHAGGLAQELKNAGFSHVAYTRLTAGVVALHEAHKRL